MIGNDSLWFRRLQQRKLTEASTAKAASYESAATSIMATPEAKNTAKAMPCEKSSFEVTPVEVK